MKARVAREPAARAVASTSGIAHRRTGRARSSARHRRTIVRTRRAASVIAGLALTLALTCGTAGVRIGRWHACHIATAAVHRVGLWIDAARATLLRGRGGTAVHALEARRRAARTERRIGGALLAARAAVRGLGQVGLAAVFGAAAAVCPARRAGRRLESALVIAAHHRRTHVGQRRAIAPAGTAVARIIFRETQSFALLLAWAALQAGLTACPTFTALAALSRSTGSPAASLTGATTAHTSGLRGATAHACSEIRSSRARAPR